MKRFFTACMLLLATIVTAQGHTLEDIDIQVVLSPNGDARITERRTMSVNSEGTEGYIVIGNLNGSRVDSLTVSDEAGRRFTTEEGDWDIHRSRSAKAHRCGIHHTGSGYELCWGLGETGLRIYTVSYSVSNLVKGYDDADGFNFMFVAEKMDPLPNHVKVTICRSDTVTFHSEDTKVWAFRYKGDVWVRDGNIVAETSEPFENRSALIVMAQFEKGVFEPADTRSGSFKEVKDRAREGSDYDEEEQEDYSWVWGLLAIIGLPALLALYSNYKTRQLRKRLLGDEKLLPWFRGVPVNGQLMRGNAIMNRLYGKSDSTGLMGAHILRLIYMRLITVTQVQNRRGRWEKVLQIAPYPEHGGLKSADERMNSWVHDLLYQAAGDDHILQPKELKKFIQKNAEDLQPMIKRMQEKADANSITPEEAQELVGMKRFLQEFTLTNERHVEEVNLWKEYLVFATLFGIADQVRKDMMAMCPEYAKMDEIAAAMLNRTDDALLYYALLNTGSQTSSFVSHELNRSSGGGGSASWGGGGGFSGGGSGGGAR